MTWSILSGLPTVLFDANGDPYSGAVLKAYLPGTTTSTSLAIDSAGSSPQTSITYNAEGKLEVSGNEIQAYIDRKCKWGIFANATDAAANTPFYMGPFDNVEQTVSREESAFSKSFPTLAAAVADDGLDDGDALNIAERATGDGGGAMWDVVLSSTVTENTYNIVQCTGIATLSLVLRSGDIIDSKQAGIPFDGTTDAKSAIETIDALGPFKLTKGTYRVASALTLTNRAYMDVDAKIKPDNGVKVTFDNLYISSVDQQGLDASAGGTFLLNVVTVVVGTDYATVQEAVDACPKQLHQWYTVHLPAGAYSEDVRIDGIYASYIQPDVASSLEGPRLTLAGQALVAKDTNVLVDSIIVSGCNGATGHPTITALSVLAGNPYTNEDTAIEIYGSHGGSISGISFASCTATRGIQSYNSCIDSNDHDFGINQLDYAYSVKHTGQIYNNTNTLPDTGTLNEAAFRLQSGDIHTYDAYDLISDGLQFVFFSAVGSLIDNQSQRVYTASEGQQVRGEFYYAEMFTSFDQWTDSSTSGTLSIVGSAARLSAAASNSAEFSLDRTNYNTVFTGADFKLAVSNLTSGIFTGSDCRIVMGSLAGAYVGFRFYLDGANDVIHGVVNDGTSGEQSILVHTAASNGRNNLEVILRNGRVRFYRSGAYIAQINVTAAMGALDTSLIHLKNEAGAGGTSNIDIEFLSVRQ